MDKLLIAEIILGFILLILPLVAVFSAMVTSISGVNICIILQLIRLVNIVGLIVLFGILVIQIKNKNKIGLIAGIVLFVLAVILFLWSASIFMTLTGIQTSTSIEAITEAGLSVQRCFLI